MGFPIALLGLLVLAGVAAWRSRGSGPRLALLASASLCAPLLLFDLTLRALDPEPRYVLEHPQHYDEHRGPLGSQALPSSRTRSVATAVEDGRVVFDVHYTLDEHGLRVTGEPTGSGTFLFFGGSFTYGFGVDDDETYPAGFYRALGGRHRVVNAAFHGYGPHQMLRAIEERTFADAVAPPLLHAFYLMLDDHLNRAVGFYRWNRDSPRYALDAFGVPRYAGLYTEYPPMRLAHALEDLGGLPWRLGRLLQAWWVPRPERMRRTEAILARSAQLVQERHGAELTVLLWDNVPWMDGFGRRLAARGVGSLRVSSLVPIGDGRIGHLRLRDRILPGVEDHPNPAFHRNLGAALARWAAQHVLDQRVLRSSRKAAPAKAR